MEKLSIIVPAYNEAANITKLVERIHETLSANHITYEVIVIDDNSKDNTKEIIKALPKTYNTSVYNKRKAKGKAQSLIEGFEYAKYDLLCMIDADLQYPPEAIPDMMKSIEKGAAIVVADRKEYKPSRVRKIISTSFRNIFGKYLFGLNHDVQSGLKVFRKEVIDTISFSPKSGWVFDLEFLHKANQAGFIIENHAIKFEERTSGESKISFLKASFEIGMNALSLKSKPIKPIIIHPVEDNSMKGAGMRFKKHKYITHTTLHHGQSAVETFISKQKTFIGTLLLISFIGLLIKPLLILQIIIALLSFIYFADVVFNLFVILKSLHFPQEITFEKEEFEALDDKLLPIYTILCPLYKEAHIIPHFLKSIEKLDYPKDKLDVMLLLEEDDKGSITAVEKMNLPQYVRMVVVPDSLPKTKPKACNYGLSFAKGEYLVIYDAEDMPDPLQLKKAFIAFKKSPKTIICLQAKLNYYNPHQNLLTRFFTAEYSLWFDVTLTGLQSFNTSLPLGGTSNHFKTVDLFKLQGWDPFNVTEDADLGIRLFKKGYTTAIIDSVTLEEANSKWGNWLRQRSRWIKGYMQTYLVHTREFFGFKGIKKKHSLIFHLVIGGKIAFILINPILWLATISYFTLHAIVGPTIESLYPSLVFYMAGTSLIFGNFLFLYYYMIGCVKRDQWNLIKFVYLVPIYWIMISVAGFIALYQLIFKPHYWEKTVHGLHLKKEAIEEDVEKATSTVITNNGFNFPFGKSVGERITKTLKTKKMLLSGVLLVAGINLANVLNLLFNGYLGRVLDYDDFAAITLATSITSLLSIPIAALSATVNHHTNFLIGKYGEKSGTKFWKKSLLLTIKGSVIVAILWTIAIPFLMHYFNVTDKLFFITFLPIMLCAFIASINRGFLYGNLMFGTIGLLYFIEPFTKLVAAVLLVNIGKNDYTYAAIPLSFVFAFILGWFFVLRRLKSDFHIEPEKKGQFPYKFLLVSLIVGLSSVSFLSMDVILAKHFLASAEAGKYALLSLVGKMIFFLGSLISPFLIPLVSRNEGANKNSQIILYYTLIGSALVTMLGYVAFGLFGFITTPFLFGPKALAITAYLPFFCLAFILFSIAQVFVMYYQAKKLYIFPITAFLLSFVQLIIFEFFHSNISTFVSVMLLSGFITLSTMTVLHLKINYVKILERNIKDFLDIFASNLSTHERTHNGLAILVFNWRDTRHKWAGGAEVYIQELAKRWVEEGHTVTIFCGNDGKSPRHEVIDGVEVIRRGGFYFVYVWAFLYYILKLRDKYDVILDSENGLPFFTPLYAKQKVYLLIHHVHQEVFRTSLRPPFSWLAQFLELKVMPFVYRNTQTITVSPSSKQQILKHKLTKDEPLIIYNGVDLTKFVPGRKHVHPVVLYLGRLQSYKSLHVFIKAAKKILKEVPNAEFIIAGEGGQKNQLQKLANSLDIASKVTFTGRVTQEQKVELMQKAWVFVNPSMMEGWGITTIEANACGTPTVASKVPGLKDSIKDQETGFLVEYNNDTEFARKIVEIIRNKPLRKKLSANAIAWAKEFDWSKSANISINLFLRETKIHMKEKMMSISPKM